MKFQSFTTVKQSKRVFELTQDGNPEFMYSTRRLSIVPFDHRLMELYSNNYLPAYTVSDLVRIIQRAKAPDYRGVLLEHSDTVNKDGVAGTIYMVSVDLSDSGVTLKPGAGYIINTYDDNEYWLQVSSVDNYIGALVGLIEVLKENNFI